MTTREDELRAATKYVDPTGDESAKWFWERRCTDCGTEEADGGCFCRRCASCTSVWMAATRDYGDEHGPPREVCPACVEAGFGPNPEPRHFTAGRRLRYRRSTGAHPRPWFTGTIEAFPSTDPDDGPDTILVRTDDGKIHHVTLATSQVEMQ